MTGFGGRRGLTTAVAALMIALAAQSVRAAPEESLAAALTAGRSGDWADLFARELGSLARSARIAPASYQIALRALRDERLEGSPGEAAKDVFSLCLRIDRALRRGAPPAEVLLQARESARLAAGSLRTGVPSESAQDRLRSRIANMGSEIYGEMERRPGPQAGPGGGAGLNEPGPPDTIGPRGGSSRSSEFGDARGLK